MIEISVISLSIIYSMINGNSMEYHQLYLLFYQ